MDAAVERELRENTKKIADEMPSMFIESIILRCKFHLLLAQQNGALPEDSPQVLADAYNSGCDIVREALIDMSCTKRVDELEASK